jgi:signal transduction histidine kinase
MGVMLLHQAEVFAWQEADMSSNITGNLSPDDPGLSPVTRAMLPLRGTVVARWMEQMRQHIEPARDLCPPILENTLPGFFDSLAALLTESQELRVRNDLGVLAVEHGNERARLSPFDSIAVIQELQLFRDALFAELDKAGIRLQDRQRALINSQVDTAIRESVNSFVAVQAALREQFVAALTHDLRTPLSNAQMAAELIARTASDPQVQQWAEKIIGNTRRIDMMTRHLLNTIVFSNPHEMELHISHFDMGALLHDVIQEARQTHAIELDLPGHSVSGYWDRDAMQRTVENLLSNAFKYGEPDPPVHVELSCTPERVKICVHNVGRPIPPEEQESIFQLYQRAAGSQDRQEGWGVGLPYARKVAEGHGGSIIVASNVTDGTTFAVDMPIDARPFVNAPSVA